MATQSRMPSGPLADAAHARVALAARVRAPLWYLLLVGALVAQHVAVQGVADLDWTLPSGVLLLLGCSAAWLGWRYQMGVTIYPAAGWRSLLALGAWSLSAFGCIAVAAASREWQIVVASALVAFAASVALGRVWAAALRDDLVHPGRWSS